MCKTYLHDITGIISNKDQSFGVSWSSMSGEVALQFGHCVQHSPVPRVQLGLAEISGSWCFVAVSSFLGMYSP